MLREKKQRCQERTQQTTSVSNESFLGQGTSAQRPRAHGPPYKGLGQPPVCKGRAAGPHQQRRALVSLGGGFLWVA